MKLEEAKEILNSIDVIDLRETHDVTEETYNLAIETVLQELEHLQKENEELKEHNRKYLEAEIFSAKQIKEFEKQRNEHYIHKDKIREKIELLENDNKLDAESVKKYEEMRRNTQDSFYRNSYQKSIHELNTKRSMRKIFISILENLLKEE